MHARLSFSAMFVIMFIFWYSVFQLPSMWGVELIWRSERRNLLIAGLELRSFDFVIWSNWTEIAASMGLHRPQVVVFNYFRFFPINLLWNIMEECQNVRPYRYFADVHVGQTRQLGNYVGRSLTNHNMFHFEKLALDSDQCYVFAGFLKRNQRQLETRSNSPIIRLGRIDPLSSALNRW